MKFLSMFALCFLLCLCFQSVTSQNAITPPRGWNSYDSFGWSITEEQYLQNAKIMARLLFKEYGYEYAVVDYLWYRSLEANNQNSRGFDNIDEWGRLLPDPKRWPSSTGGISSGDTGFSAVSDKVHRMGLKFGIHVMAGISTQAYDKNTPIFDTRTGLAYNESGRVWHARDIAIPARACKWMPNGFMAINITTGAGKAFLRSLYDVYYQWRVDFVKLDCVFGEDLDVDEITYVSQLLNELNPSIVFSLSPGVKATPDMAKKVNGLVNMYRVTGDDWDIWSAVLTHFDVARDFAAAKLIGAQGLNGKSWPDLDMLPFGWLTHPEAKEGPHRMSRLNQYEQRTQFTLWCMAKSPIMYGGDLRNLTAWKNDGLIANPTLLWINSNSSNNAEFSYITSLGDVKIEGQNVTNVQANSNSTAGIRSWVATGNKRRAPKRNETYVAFFNLKDQSTTISAKIEDLAEVLPGKKLRGCKGKEIWSGRRIKLEETLSAEVVAHGCALFVLNC